MVLRSGVIYGRRTFGNIIKYIKMTASSNFGNMFSMIGASAFYHSCLCFRYKYLPKICSMISLSHLFHGIQWIRISWKNLKMGCRQYQEVYAVYRFLSSIFDYITFAVMFFIFKANAPEHQSLFQTGWFVEGLLSQTLIVHIIRTKKYLLFRVGQQLL